MYECTGTCHAGHILDQDEDILTEVLANSEDIGPEIKGLISGILLGYYLV
jgi:hypothetical protein